MKLALKYITYITSFLKHSILCLYIVQLRQKFLKISANVRAYKLLVSIKKVDTKNSCAVFQETSLSITMTKFVRVVSQK